MRGTAAGTVVRAPAADLGVRGAAERRDRLAVAMAPGGSVRIHLGEVTAMDTAIVQVFLAGVRSAGHLGCSRDFATALEGQIAGYMAAIGLPNEFGPAVAASGL